MRLQDGKKAQMAEDFGGFKKLKLE